MRGLGALSSGRLDRFAFEQLLLALPRSARSIEFWVDGRSQSVLESVARVRVRRRGWRAETQVRVGELGAIDLVVGGVVALELDGREHHEASFEADRRKDLSILLEQRIPVRVTYSMLVHEWARIEGAISAVLATPGRRRAHDSVITPAPPGGRRHARGARRIFD